MIGTEAGGMTGTEAGGRYAGASKKIFGQYEPERGHLAPAFAVFCDTIVKIVYWTEQGCIREAEIIPVEEKGKIEMHSGGRNNPCGTEKQDRDAFSRSK